MVEYINIIVVTDDNYVQHLGVMITSLYENSEYSALIKIHVIYGQLTPNNVQHLQNIVHKNKGSIEFLPIEAVQFKHLSVRNNMSHAAYYKILIPELLGHRLEKAIYLDCDLIVKHDIFELWKLDISNALIAAVKQPFNNNLEKFKFVGSDHTFNSGVMVLNLKKCKEQELTRKALDFAKENSSKISLHDQTVLNVVTEGDWLELSPRWNQLTSFIYASFSQLGWSFEEWTNIYKNPYIIHYSSTKPWYFLNDHPYKSEYYHFLEKTPWRKFVPLGKNEAEFLFEMENIIVFGAGSGGERVSRTLRENNISIAFYVDNDQKKWNKDFNGLTVLPPHILEELNKANTAIFIASYSYYEDIARQLTDIGYEENKNFIAGLGRR